MYIWLWSNPQHYYDKTIMQSIITTKILSQPKYYHNQNSYIQVTSIYINMVKNAFIFKHPNGDKVTIKAPTVFLAIEEAEKRKMIPEDWVIVPKLR